MLSKDSNPRAQIGLTSGDLLRDVGFGMPEVQQHASIRGVSLPVFKPQLDSMLRHVNVLRSQTGLLPSIVIDMVK